MQILRAKQAAKLLGISRTTLYRWAARPGFPVRIKIGPRTSGYRSDEIEQWIEQQVDPDGKEAA
jgi:prophage regulatory protein